MRLFISSNLEQTKRREIWNGKKITQPRKVSLRNSFKFSSYFECNSWIWYCL